MREAPSVSDALTLVFEDGGVSRTLEPFDGGKVSRVLDTFTDREFDELVKLPTAVGIDMSKTAHIFVEVRQHALNVALDVGLKIQPERCAVSKEKRFRHLAVKPIFGLLAVHAVSVDILKFQGIFSQLLFQSALSSCVKSNIAASRS